MFTSSRKKKPPREDSVSFAFFRRNRRANLTPRATSSLSVPDATDFDGSVRRKDRNREGRNLGFSKLGQRGATRADRARASVRENSRGAHYVFSENYRMFFQIAVVTRLPVDIVMSLRNTATRTYLQIADGCCEVRHPTCLLSRNARSALARLTRKRHVTRHHVIRAAETIAIQTLVSSSRGSIIDHRRLPACDSRESASLSDATFKPN